MNSQELTDRAVELYREGRSLADIEAALGAKYVPYNIKLLSSLPEPTPEKEGLLDTIKVLTAENEVLRRENDNLAEDVPIIVPEDEIVTYRDGKGGVFRKWGMDRDKFLALEIPEREPLLVTQGGTVLYSSSINQILAWRGVGKTMFALAMAGALASGERFLDFTPTRPARVVYVDGEFPMRAPTPCIFVPPVNQEIYRHSIPSRMPAAIITIKTAA